MKIAIVAPSPVPFTLGGAERAWAGLHRALNEQTSHDVELVKLPVREDTLPNLIAGYRAFAELNVSHFDLVISSKYPAWLLRHRNHVVWMFHPLRGLYDTYRVFGLPEFADSELTEVRSLIRFLTRSPSRAELGELFDVWDLALKAAGPAHPDLALPSPLARSIVHWLDAVALAPGETHCHVALSRTVAGRANYFPATVKPAIAYAPSDLAAHTGSGSGHFFTASRLDGPKRIDLLIEAMAYVPGGLPLLIGGGGPLAADLAAQAAHDSRIRFLGFVPDDELAGLYADSVAVPFIPADEDYGLIAVEAMACGRPVVTCHDSGGPTELIVEGVTGLVAEPTPRALGAALAKLSNDLELADQLGANAQRRAGEITWAATINTLLGSADTTTEPLAASSRRASLATSKPTVASGLGTSAGRAGQVGRPRVVALTTFGIAEPRHGGQLRCNHLYGSLARHVDVEVIALVDDPALAGDVEVAPGLRQSAVLRSVAHQQIGTHISGDAGMVVTDIVAGTHITETPAYLARLRDALRGASAVLLAEPYLLPALEAVGSTLPFVYDAFNVEAELKATSLPKNEVGRVLLESVVEIERRAVTGAAAISTCSSEDAKRLSLASGRSLTDFTVVPNGTDCAVRVPTSAERRAHSAAWRHRWATHRPHGTERDALAVFFASWHPPNLDAAEILLWLAPQLPEVQFVLGGSHGDAFKDRVPPDNLVFTGMLTERSKRTLLNSADVALNPMLQGSGTNLKVIEYLAGAAPVVSTSFGVRGLDVVDGVHLTVAEPHEMVNAVRNVLADPTAAATRAAAGRELALTEYDWTALGDRLAAVVRTARAGLGSAPAAPASPDR